LIITGLFVLSVFVHYLPPLACCFFWERLLMALARLIRGITNLAIPPFVVPTYLLANPTPQSVRLFAYYIVGLSISGLLAGLAVEALWKWGRRGKAILVVGLMLNTVPGLLFALLTYVGPPHIACEYFFSQTHDKRVVVYPGQGMHHFILETTDGGKTWQQLEYFAEDSTSRENLFCDDIESQEDEL
jgi:hypothetical protein